MNMEIIKVCQYLCKHSQNDVTVCNVMINLKCCLTRKTSDQLSTGSSLDREAAKILKALLHLRCSQCSSDNVDELFTAVMDSGLYPVFGMLQTYSMLQLTSGT